MHRFFVIGLSNPTFLKPFALSFLQFACLSVWLNFSGFLNPVHAGESQQVLIPEGTFEMGSRRSLLELDPVGILQADRHMLGPENPAHEVYLDAFYIDVHEVSNREFNEYVKATGTKPSRFHDDPAFNGDDQPVVGVTWKQAKKYCQWKNMRLPTEAEWEKAARGKRPVRFPWGDEPPNETLANFNNHIGKTSPVTDYKKGASDYGVLNLSGNVSEWVKDWHYPEYYLFSPKENPPGPEKGHYKVIRGGNWKNKIDDIRLTYRNATVPSTRRETVGFRCARSAGSDSSK